MYISSSIFLTTDLIVKQHQTEKKKNSNIEQIIPKKR